MLIYPDNALEIIRINRGKIRPRIKPLPSDYADQYYTISEGAAKGNRWKTSDVEYTRDILNSISDPQVEEVSVMSSAQIFKTTIGLILTNFIYEFEKDSMMDLLPTVEVGEKYSKTKLEQSLYQVESLRDRLSRKSRDAKNTTLFKEIAPGVYHIIAGGNSPNSLSTISVKYVKEDEIDRIPASAGKEGDPCFLAEQRIESYRLLGAKIFRFSTPTNSGDSRIEKKVNLGTKEKPYVPCIHCGHMQHLKFFPEHDKEKDEYYGGIIWDKDKDVFGKTIKHYPETARYRCISCRKDMYEADKRGYLLKNVKWIKENPEVTKHRSFYGLSRLYSILSTWVQIVELWLDSAGDPEMIKVFTNTVLGEIYKEDQTQQVKDQNEIMTYTEDYLTDSNPYLPNEILLLTCQVDTHPSRLEVEIDGWGIGEENWLVHYEQIWGDPDLGEVFNQLDDLLERKWKRNDGLELPIGGFINNVRHYATMIDSGGFMANTKSVYEYVRTRQLNGIIAIKGQPKADNNSPILLNQSLVGKNRDVILQNLGVNTIKPIIWKRIQCIPGGPKTIHYTSAFCDYKYFGGLFSEEPFTYYDKRSNTKKMLWKKKRKGIRNEPFDLKVYGYANLKSLSVDMLKMKEKRDEEVKLLNNHEADKAPVQIESKKVLPGLKRVGASRYNPNI